MVETIPIPLSVSNAFLLKGERPILVDSGNPNETPAILNALQQAEVAPEELALILHTHAHGDHCGSSLDLKRLGQIPTAIHRADEEMLQKGLNGPLVPTSQLLKLMMPLMPPGTFSGFQADLVIDEEEIDLAEYGVEAKVIHTPGHTPGSVSVITADGEAIIGDVLMGGLLGFWRPHQPHYHLLAYDLDLIRASLQKIMSYAPTRLYVGHGGPLRAEDVIQQFGWQIEF